MLPVLAMAMKHPGRNINLNAAPHWFPHDHVIFDRLAHQGGNRWVEPQSLKEHQAQARPVAQIVEGCDTLRRKGRHFGSLPRLLAVIECQQIGGAATGSPVSGSRTAIKTSSKSR
jgi:hypothetical protein